jgi:hypothetical protein
MSEGIRFLLRAAALCLECKGIQLNSVFIYQSVVKFYLPISRQVDLLIEW